MKILAIGPLWRGSNAGGMFQAMSRQGCLIEVVDEFYHISLQGRSKKAKVMQRLIRPTQTVEFNNAIRKQITIFRPHVLFVYKGAFVLPQTLHFARAQGCKLALFYPDVSMTAHGPNIPACIPLYDIVFTTKTFGITDMAAKFGVRNAHFIPHGFDPQIHRKLQPTWEDMDIYGCDVSFIGTWSPKKEKWLGVLKERVPAARVRIWGEQWGKATTPSIKDAIQDTAVLGDLYALAIQCSAINLGILSEQVAGSSSGDLITSRTFHIPGSSGFMLHERNEESVLYFKEDEEAGFFSGPDEMADKVARYLQDSRLREQVREAGYARALRDHSLDERAKVVLGLLGQKA